MLYLCSEPHLSVLLPLHLGSRDAVRDLAVQLRRERGTGFKMMKTLQGGQVFGDGIWALKNDCLCGKWLNDRGILLAYSGPSYWVAVFRFMYCVVIAWMRK